MAHNGHIQAAHVDFLNGYVDQPFICANKCQQDLVLYAYSTTDSAAAFYGYLDSRGYPTQMPAGAGAYWRTSNMTLYGKVNDIWVVTWPGTADCTLEASAPLTLSNTLTTSNRREYTITGVGSGGSNTSALCNLRINSMVANNFVGGEIKVFRKSDETALNAGEIYTPEFLARYASVGRIRLMNWTIDWVSPNNGLTRWAYRNTTDALSFGARIQAECYCGAQTARTGNDFTVNQPPTSFGAWADGQVVHFIYSGGDLTWITVSGVTNATTPTVTTSTAHGLATGDVIQFFPDTTTNWRALSLGPGGSSYVHLQVTVLTSTTFTVAALVSGISVDSTSWGAYPGNYKFCKVPTLKVGAVSPVRMTTWTGFQNFSVGAFSDNSDNFCTGVYNATLGVLHVDNRNVPGGTTNHYLCPKIPHEYAISLAKKLNCHIHINLPIAIIDDSVSQMAALYRDGLAGTGLQVFVEYQNEWYDLGGNYYDTKNYANAMANTISGCSGTWEYNYWVGYRVGQISDLWKTAYGANQRTYNICMGLLISVGLGPYNPGPPVSGYFLYNDWAQKRFQVPPFSAGDTTKYPINKCHEVCTAGYFAPCFDVGNNPGHNATDYPGWADKVYEYTLGGASAQNTFNWMRDQFIASASSDQANYPVANSSPIGYMNANLVPGCVSLAATYGLPLAGYEGGQNITDIYFGTPCTPPSYPGHTVTSTDVDNCYQAFQQSSQYATVVTDYANGWIAAGATWPMWFVMAGNTNSTNSYWPLIKLNNGAIDGPENWSDTPASTAWRNVVAPTIHRGGHGLKNRF